MIDIPIKIEANPLIDRMVAPHNLVSQVVTDENIGLVVNDLKVLYQLCFVRNGIYNGNFAMHHSQIEDRQPLNIFVTHLKEIVCNPVITNKTKATVDSPEGCASFPNIPPIIVQRSNKIEIDYQTVIPDPEHPEDEYCVKLSEVKHKSLSGHEAKVWQHEVDHGLGKLIYNLEEKHE